MAIADAVEVVTASGRRCRERSTDIHVEKCTRVRRAMRMTGKGLLGALANDARNALRGLLRANTASPSHHRTRQDGTDAAERGMSKATVPEMKVRRGRSEGRGSGRRHRSGYERDGRSWREDKATRQEG